MSKRERMTDERLVSHIELLESQSGGQYTSAVANEQALAMDYYLGRPFGTEEEGRSAVISSDVWDVVEGLTPLVLKPFVSSDDVVKFAPEGPDDEEAADQESDYVNYVVTQKNDIFESLVSWVKTGLLQKNGVVKYWWETSTRKTIERYYDISDDEYAMLLQEDSVDVLAHSEKAGAPQLDQKTGQPAEDPQTGQPMPSDSTHDVVLRISKPHGEARYQVIPPEEFLVSIDATSANPKSARFCEHRRKLTISAVREMGYDVDDDINDTSYADDIDTSPQYIARRQYEDGIRTREQGNDPSSREVLLRDVYVMVDADGDGIAELRNVCLIGTTVLHNEETEEIPFCGWTPYPQPFKYDGRCPADEAMEIQKIKSTVLRQTMDNIYTINNNTRYVSSKVNLDDLLDNQIAGIVRVDGDVVSNHVMPGPVTPIGAITMPMIEYFDSAKENRTGFTRYNQGTDSNSLNKTATGVRIIAEAGNERVGLVSRCFAEQGLKPLMLGIHGLLRRHGGKAETIRLRGKWVTIDPRDWKERYDMTVSVGLGTADKQLQLQGAEMLLDKQVELMQLQSPVVTPKNLFEAGSKLAAALGEKNPEKFFTAPPDQPPAPPDPTQNPEVMMKVKELKQKDQQMEMDNTHKTRELDIKEQEFQLRKQESHAGMLTNHARLSRELAESHHKVDSEAASQQAEQEQADQEQAEGSDVADALAKLSEQIAAIQKQISALAAQTPEPAEATPDGQA